MDVSDLKLVERFPVRWGNLSEDAYAERVADDTFDLTVSKWIARAPGPFERVPTPSLSTPFLLGEIRATTVQVFADGADELAVRVALNDPIPDPLVVHRASKSDVGHLSFDEALDIFAKENRILVANRIRQGATYWFFPIRQIGSCGVIVSKIDGVATPAGSAFPVDDWLWGYENGLLSVEPVDLLITRVMDVENTRRLLRKELCLRPSSPVLSQIDKPPLLVENAVNWMAIRWLRFDSPAAFQWVVARRDNRTA